MPLESLRRGGKTVALHLLKTLGVFALSRRLTRSMPRILCYHGGSLGDEHLFNPKLFCRPGLLAQRLQWLQHHGFVPASLSAVLHTHPGAPARQGIALLVTLDDGWYSSATELLPLLARYRHRPVLYLATKVFAHNTPVLDVCLRYLLWKTRCTSVQLEGFDPALDGHYALNQPSERARFSAGAQRWLASFDTDRAASHAALERLAQQLGISAQTLNLASRRFSYMQHNELWAAHRHGCQIELHGHAHHYHSGHSGDPARNQADIQTCRQHLLANGLPAAHHYCYPSGVHDAQAPSTLRDIGVRSAVTCQPGLVQHAARQRYQLPRFLDGGDVSMIEFEAEMSGVLPGLRRLWHSFQTASRAPSST